MNKGKEKILEEGGLGAVMLGPLGHYGLDHLHFQSQSMNELSGGVVWIGFGNGARVEAREEVPLEAEFPQGDKP